MIELRRIPIYGALNRAHLLLGAERTLVLMTLLLSTLICMTAAHFWTLWLGVCLGFSLHLIWVAMAKSDPRMSEIYLRHVRYQSYYPPVATIDAKIPVVHKWKD